MSTSSVESDALNSLMASYEPYQTEDTSSSSELDSDDFIELLVAEIENQNPLDPTDTSGMADSLSSYTQVSELEELNDKMDDLIDSTTASGSEDDALDYVGMQVTGEVNTMTVEDGTVTSGFYDLSESAEVVIVIQDENGNVVNTLDEGQVDAGSYLIAWDGTDDSGDAVADGSYTYAVMANTGSGFEQVTSTVTGSVDAVVYQNGEPYLQVGSILMDPDSVTTVTDTADSASDGSTSILEYLGTTVTSNYPIVQVSEGQVSGEDLSFYLESAQDVTVTVYDSTNEAVATIEIAAEDTQAGDNTVYWDALEDTGYQADDGLYYYTVTTDSGSAATPVEGEVTGIQVVNGAQYLELGETGRLLSLSTVTSVQ
ncbi:MAG: flagellar hook capping protein [Desulfobacterales bacterium]|nr:flagellar hook capping protein [Desulfobacterales bacterium]